MICESFEPHPLTAQQIADLCAALRGERPDRDGKPLPAFPVYALMVEFASYTGLRASELAGLGDRRLGICAGCAGAPPKLLRSCRADQGKGEAAGEGWIVGTPKSKRSRRSVPLPGWLAAKMAHYLAHDHPRAAETDAPLWPSHAGRVARTGPPTSEWLTALDWSQPVELGTFYRYTFARALQAVGLPVMAPARDGTGARRQASDARRAVTRSASQRRGRVAASRCAGCAGVSLARSRSADDHAQRVRRLDHLGHQHRGHQIAFARRRGIDELLDAVGVRCPAPPRHARAAGCG